MNPTKYYSSKQEQTVADYLDWRVVSGSGARDNHPGDVISADWLGECKTHTEPGHKIEFKLSVWRKLINEASSKFKYPVLIVDDGSQKMQRTWCLFPLSTVTSDEIKIMQFPKSVRSNILFEFDSLDCNDNVVYSTQFNSSTAGVCRLETFRILFGRG